MAYEKLYLAKRLKKAGKIPATLITFIVVTLGWVVFRADSLQHALGLYKVMFLPQYKSIEFIITPELITLLLMAAFFSFAAMIPKVESLQMKLFTGIRSTFGLGVMTVTALLLFAAGLSYVVASGFNPFIYFRF
jgi:alginate O-acetyltransferase complex protein AlgI